MTLMLVQTLRGRYYLKIGAIRDNAVVFASSGYCFCAELYHIPHLREAFRDRCRSCLSLLESSYLNYYIFNFTCFYITYNTI